MNLQTHKTTKVIKKIPTGAYWAMAGVVCLAGSIGTICQFTKASSSEYSLTGNSVELNGQSDGTATVALKTSVARTYVAIQGTWSLHEVVTTGATQTSYLSLSGMKRGGSITASYGTNGVTAWTPEDGIGMPVVAGGEVLTATYTVDKDTPAGTYKVSFSNGLFTYDANGVDEDEADIIANDATITVTRSEQSGDDSGSGGTDDGGDSGGGSTDGGGTDSGDDSGSGDGSTDGGGTDGGDSGSADDDSSDGGNTDGGSTDGGNTDSGDSNDEDGDGSSAPSGGSTTPTTPSGSSGSTDGELLVPDTGEILKDSTGANVTVISVVAIAVIAFASAIVVQLKNRKTITFNKTK